MQHRSSEHRHYHYGKHQRRVDTAESKQVAVSKFELMPHRLIDTPPYSNIYVTSRGFEAIRPEAAQRKVGVVNYGRSTDEYRKDGYDKVYEEDVDAEADEFIKHEHKKFQLSKWLSMNGG